MKSESNAPDPRLHNRTRTIVIRRGGHKRILRASAEVEPGDAFVADRPHADGDFSYICDFPWCRCMQ